MKRFFYFGRCLNVCKSCNMHIFMCNRHEFVRNANSSENSERCSEADADTYVPRETNADGMNNIAESIIL